MANRLASAQSGIKTLPDLIGRAEQRPGEISFAAIGIGRLTHLTGLLLASKAGIKLEPVPCAGGPAAVLTDCSRSWRLLVSRSSYSIGARTVIAVARSSRSLPGGSPLPAGLVDQDNGACLTMRTKIIVSAALTMPIGCGMSSPGFNQPLLLASPLLSAVWVRW
jgi:hypothetical protein